MKGAVYDAVRLVGEGARMTLEVDVLPRANGKILCSRCLRPAPGYDTARKPRRFDFVPLWNIPVVLLYRMRRVKCRRCGVCVEAVPWAEGKQRTTRAFAWFLASWAKRLSWKQTSEAFHTSWDTVARAVRMAVDWGLAHRLVAPQRYPELTHLCSAKLSHPCRRFGARQAALARAKRTPTRMTG